MRDRGRNEDAASIVSSKGEASGAGWACHLTTITRLKATLVRGIRGVALARSAEGAEEVWADGG